MASMRRFGRPFKLAPTAASRKSRQQDTVGQRQSPAVGLLDAPQPQSHIVMLRASLRERLGGFQNPIHNIARFAIAAGVDGRHQAPESPFLACSYRKARD